jgi:hypothetical protein
VNTGSVSDGKAGLLVLGTGLNGCEMFVFVDYCS